MINAKIFGAMMITGLFVFGTTPFQAQTCASAPVGLVSAWSGDNNVLDARSRSNGTIQNGVNYIAGEVGQALDLAGNNGDRILVGNPANLQLQNFTIEAWIKRSSSTVVTNSPNGSGVGIFFAYGQGGYAFYIDQSTNKLAVGQVGVSQKVAPTLTITDTNWHHVAVTQNGIPFSAGDETIFYLDGVADTTLTSQNPQYSFTTNAAIGTRGDGVTDNVFFGAIDELAIYNRPLTLTELQSIYNSGTSGKCKPLATKAPDNQFMWLAGDGDANDISGNGNNGTLQNGASIAVGKVGQGFTFDGADDQITVPHNASQNVGTRLSIEAWIKPSSLPYGGTIVQKRTSGNIGGYLLEPTQVSGGGSPNGLQFVIMIGGVYQSLNPANVITANVWQHLAATYDGAFMRIYVNGVEVGNKPQTGAIDAVTAPIQIGRNIVNTTGFPGAIDELSLYSRTLSADEIQSIANAGLAGKYKVQSTVPSDTVAWYPGDGNTNDLQAANNGTLQGSATYATGKVGQAFSLNGTNAYVSAPSTMGNDPTGAGNGASMEAWVYFNQRPSDAGHQMYIMSKTGTGLNDGFEIRVDADNFIKYVWRGTVIGFTTVSVQTGVWYHVVATFNPNTIGPTAGTLLYVNGVLLGGGNEFNPRTPSGVPLDIGYSSALGGNRYFDGLIDEPTIYDRTLTREEINGLFNAGNGGKFKGAANPTITNKTKAGDAEVTFGGITNAGAVHLTSLDSTLFPSVPMGTNTGLNFDISTSANHTNPTVCFNVSSFTPAQFVNLRILHLESGVWQNRSAIGNIYPNLCTTGLPSLSPFAISQVAPTAANASVSGRVTTTRGTGIRNVRVSVTTSSGDVFQAITSSFGYYSFDNLAVGDTYILSVSAKKYSFANPARIIFLLEDLKGEDFAADEITNAKSQSNSFR